MKKRLIILGIILVITLTIVFVIKLDPNNKASFIQTNNKYDQSDFKIIDNYFDLSKYYHINKYKFVLDGNDYEDDELKYILKKYARPYFGDKSLLLITINSSSSNSTNYYRGYTYKDGVMTIKIYEKYAGCTGIHNCMIITYLAIIEIPKIDNIKEVKISG